MKKTLTLGLSALLAGVCAGPVVAQESQYHPALSDNFMLSIGAFVSDSAYTLSASGRTTVEVESEDIDFGDSVGVDESSTIANVQLRWKFGKQRKWSLWGQYFSNSSDSDATLEEDIEWLGLVFREGSFIDGGIDIEIARLFVGRNIIKNAQHDLGVGAGIHNIDIGAYIGGEIKINDVTTEYQRASASASQLLPNIGAWYNFSWDKRWLLHGRVDWISANVGDYDGSMWNFNAGLNFQAFEHFGIDLSYQYFDIDLEVTRESWTGGAEMRYSGPVVAATFNW